VRGLQIAHRSDRGVGGGVARIALQHRRGDDKRLAKAAGETISSVERLGALHPAYVLRSRLRSDFRLSE
jgi:hypothetical protein